MSIKISEVKSESSLFESKKNSTVKKIGQSRSDNFLIMNILPEGKENAINSEDLARLIGCKSVRELQHHIAYERNHGAVICSGFGKGYWKPKNREEIVEFCRTMDARARNTFAATRSAKRALRMLEHEQVIESRERNATE